MPNYPHIPCDSNYLDRKEISIWHDKFNGWCGYLQCELKVLTPLRINTWGENKSPQTINGSTLKGMIRSVAEIVSQSCFRTDDKFISPFDSCKKGTEVCTCCRLFGGSFKDDKVIMAYQSKVLFEDAKPIPQPNNQLKDIKVFIEHQNCQYAEGRRVFTHSKPKDEQGVVIWTAKEGTVFKFNIYLENLDDDELGLLLYSLELEPNMAHKLGYMKSRGLGSVKVTIVKMELTNTPKERFLQFDSSLTTINTSDPNEVARFVRKYADLYLQNKNLNNSPHLQKLRELMKYTQEKGE